jgi:hypothetical protein
MSWKYAPFRILPHHGNHGAILYSQFKDNLPVILIKEEQIHQRFNYVQLHSAVQLPSAVQQFRKAFELFFSIFFIKYSIFVGGSAHI